MERRGEGWTCWFDNLPRSSFDSAYRSCYFLEMRPTVSAIRRQSRSVPASTSPPSPPLSSDLIELSLVCLYPRNLSRDCTVFLSLYSKVSLYIFAHRHFSKMKQMPGTNVTGETLLYTQQLVKEQALMTPQGKGKSNVKNFSPCRTALVISHSISARLGFSFIIVRQLCVCGNRRGFFPQRLTRIFCFQHSRNTRKILYLFGTKSFATHLFLFTCFVT